jgi:hypothetical protein
MKIAITLDMSVAFWANGMQQNIVFLYSLLSKAGNDCYYVTFKPPSHELQKDHKGMLLDDMLKDKNEVFDVVIVAGFDLLPEMYDELKKRNPNLKIILVHFGNKLMDDIHYGICNIKSGKQPLQKPDRLDQVWISPHHAFSKEYIKTYYDTENVFVAPYIWDNFFVDQKIKELKDRDLSPDFKQKEVSNVCIFEPNISHLKNCIIPLAICERFNKIFPEELGNVNAFGCNKIRDNVFFQKLMNKFEIVQNTEKCFFNNRWGSLDALSKFGSTVVSHQFYNELNYSHFEVLYLGLPLVHNSPRLENVGYYYPEFDVEMGAKQLKNAIQNHSSTINAYKKDAEEFLKNFSPHSEDNIKGYIELLKHE